MTDPFADVSPWDKPAESAPETPVVNTTMAPRVPGATHMNPFKIGLTFKASASFDGEWITPTIYGSTADETARRAVELMHALRQHGVIDLATNAAEYTRQQFKGSATKPGAAAPKRFAGGKVQTTTDAEHQGETDCPHGRTHVAKGTWEAYFCNADERAGEKKCPAAFLNKKSGRFEIKG
ncbi:hypothetical protein IPZ58_05040 [Streptomyces roseoverticillatus]|uniref:hypothetical protein n=1 Tax=Streptomyces roseoverticillatus TaxID=66429 RepID=UPI001F468332|nr:hypothetical protein [Streptomyces roseoverticillatus]MCF3100940.1 hypothetical protein [Streptomyces roseoverticillatus]